MTRPIGIHLSYWQRSWTDDLIPLVERAAQAGYDGAEIPLLEPERLDLEGLRAALDAAGLQATCGTGLNPATDITHPDESVRRAGAAHLRRCLEAAAALGSPVLGGVTYAPWGLFPQDDRAARRRRAIATLREVSKIAADLDVLLCLEVLNRFEGYLLNTVSQGLAFLGEIDASHVKLHLDTFHLNIEEVEIEAAIVAAGEQLGHFHCSENHRGFPGTGHVPWQAVDRALNAIGYRGWLVVEPYLRPEGEVGRDLFVWRALTRTPDADARAGAEFLRSLTGA
jgi:D-psicose/D-tagatose/L-ribulose 3-epimerase